MTVTSVQEVTPKSYKIYIDEEFAFALSKSELSRYAIKEGAVIEEVLYNSILEIITKRAKRYVLNLLGKMDRTRDEITAKLKRYNYNDDVIKEAIAYADKFGYINDERYALNIVSSKKRNKSSYEIKMILAGKGFSPEIIDMAMSTGYENDDELLTIERLIEKKGYNYLSGDKIKEQKIIAYLLRKGFKLDKIRQVLQRERS